MPIPGMKHICDNLVNDMTKALVHYKWFFTSLTWFDHLLGRPFYRSRLEATCLKDTGYDKALSGWDVRLSTGRWSVLLLFLAHLLRIEGVLKQFWDSRKFCFDRRGSTRAVDEETLDEQMLDHITVH